LLKKSSAKNFYLRWASGFHRQRARVDKSFFGSFFTKKEPLALRGRAGILAP
jgi:hypothetical protein